LLRLRARTGFPLDAPFGSLPAGPHERCRRSTNQSAFHRRELPRKPAPNSPFRARPLPRRLSPESSFLARARSPVSPRPRPQRTERTRHRSSTSATDVKVEHTRERPVTPPADVFSADGCQRRQRAAEHRLPGWESSSRSTGRLHPTKLRHEAERPARMEGGHPCRAAGRPKTRRGSDLSCAPRLASDPPRER